VVINATPLGMAGEALPGGIVAAAGGLIDLAYGAFPTPAVVAAAQEGVPVVDGLTLLVDQAAAAFQIWTGREAPRAVMEAAARAGESLKEG
jgi:shikimate dehydrogenase